MGPGVAGADSSSHRKNQTVLDQMLSSNKQRASVLDKSQIVKKLHRSFFGGGGDDGCGTGQDGEVTEPDFSSS